jgi:hypothetical protein
MELKTKSQMLDSIRAHRDRWEALLAEVSEERMLKPGVMGSWTFKDVAAHLTGWRNRVTIDRLEAGMRDEPLPPPPWPSELDEDADGDVQVINEWIYQHNQKRSVSDVLADARESWRRMEAAVEGLSEQDLLDPNRFSWLNGYALAEVVPGSSGHFEEHEEMIRAWLDGAKGRADQMTT